MSVPYVYRVPPPVRPVRPHVAELGLGGGVIVVPSTDPNPLKWRSSWIVSAGLSGAGVVMSGISSVGIDQPSLTSVEVD